tara:strand:- start:72697 stop:72939 length:243 start_codon:yes stop_codon:yes gene_type:complete
MSKLNDANERLDAALARLEVAVTKRRQEDGDADGAAEENRRLQSELAQLRADFVTLKETSGTVSSRLDDAIGRLRHMLAQ